MGVCPTLITGNSFSRADEDLLFLIPRVPITSAEVEAIELHMLTLLALFAVSFLAATILPLSSEVLFGALIAEGYSLGSLLFWATLGNTLGACVNWWLGTLLRSNYSRFEDYRWIRITGKEIERAGLWFNRYGKWSLLVAWAPVLGDGLTVFAGIARVPLWQLAALAGIGKFTRYFFIAQIATTLIN